MRNTPKLIISAAAVALLWLAPVRAIPPPAADAADSVFAASSQFDKQSVVAVCQWISIFHPSGENKIQIIHFRLFHNFKSTIIQPAEHFGFG